jgi:CO/xanthine dehydrogenase Mo-binding subunit
VREAPNEIHKRLVRAKDKIRQAFLCRLVTELLPAEPEALGLLALMLHAEARRHARRDGDGEYVPLAKQDPALWDGQMIEEAETLLRRAGAGRNAGSVPNSVGGARRQAAVLARVAEKVGWGKPTPKDVGLGIATTFGQERSMPTWTACAARVRVNRTNGHVTVEKLSLVIDAGTVIHPNSAEAQVEGAALWGLSMALREGSEFVKGQPKDTNLDTYALLRMGDVPDVEVEFLPSTEAPVGLGEPATTPVAPAIGNAIFAATGARVRHLPIRPQAVLVALARGN